MPIGDYWNELNVTTGHWVLSQLVSVECMYDALNLETNTISYQLSNYQLSAWSIVIPALFILY